MRPLLVTCFLSAARPAYATPQVDARAVELYHESVARYREGRYSEAAALLREAYGREPDPVLLYDLGRACERMNDARCAVDAYERYLAQASPPDRAAIEQRIEAYRKQLAAPAATEPERRPSAVPWIAAGTGVAILGAGVVLAVVADAKHGDAVNEPQQQTAADLEASAEHTATLANVLLITGGAIAVAGVVWGLLDVHAASARVSAGVGLGSFAVRVVF